MTILSVEQIYAIYNIGNHAPENLLEFVNILQEELIRAGVLPADYDFVLTQMYGSYMEPPSREEMNHHSTRILEETD